MTTQATISSFDRRVYDAIKALKGNAYGATVYRCLAGAHEDNPFLALLRGASVGAIYCAAERLEAAGYVRSQSEPGGPERGGRDKRYWFIAREMQPEGKQQ